jgi:hypothetical protein
MGSRSFTRSRTSPFFWRVPPRGEAGPQRTERLGEARGDAPDVSPAPRVTWLPRSFRDLAGVVALVALSTARVAHAVPSFARQTGFPCVSCHTVFPQLTPLGRAFKLQGYTMSADMTELPPLAAMVQGAPGFTHTRRAQPDAGLPSGVHGNNNVSINQASLFYAGRLLGPYADHMPEGAAKRLNSVGIFAQGTWNGFQSHWAWDNTEIRAAGSRTLAGTHVVFGG